MAFRTAWPNPVRSLERQPVARTISRHEAHSLPSRGGYRSRRIDQPVSRETFVCDSQQSSTTGAVARGDVVSGIALKPPPPLRRNPRPAEAGSKTRRRDS